MRATPIWFWSTSFASVAGARRGGALVGSASRSFNFSGAFRTATWIASISIARRCYRKQCFYNTIVLYLNRIATALPLKFRLVQPFALGCNSSSLAGLSL